MKRFKPYLLLCCILLTSCATIADVNGESDSQNYRVRLYFGLSLPTGGGVSLKQWQDFQSNTLAKNFDGFNVVDSTGYYQSAPERSKIVTIITNQQGMDKVNKVAQIYAKRFNQESVMMVKIKVDEWSFITPSA